MVTRYDIEDPKDLQEARRQRALEVQRSHRQMGKCFDRLKQEYRLPWRTLHRLCSFRRSDLTEYRHRKAEFSHQVALGMVALHNDIVIGAVGHWKLRLDGSPWKYVLPRDLEPNCYVRPIPWHHVFDEMFTAGFSLREIALVSEESAPTLSKVSWPDSNPSLPIGEAILWVARQARAGVIRPARRDLRNGSRPRPRVYGGAPEPVVLPDPLGA